MHTNYCSKCGQAFETKNPKRIVCPNCLYLDRAAAPSIEPLPRQQAPYGQPHQGYGAPQHQQPYGQPRYPQQHGPGQGGGYGGPQNQGAYPQQQRPRGFGGPPPQGGPGGGFRRGGPPYQGGGFQGPRGGGGFRPQGGGPRRPPAKKLLIPKEVMFEIEKRYKAMLPLPNPDAHVTIAQALEIEPNKVFFGINLVRKKMKLPPMDYPKRPLAVTPDQLTAVRALYEGFLPLPPIGIHKIISKQLRMDEWRVHVAIGLIRKEMALPRWNEEREDLPPKMKEELEAAKAKAAAESNGAESADKEPAKATKKVAKKTPEAALED